MHRVEIDEQRLVPAAAHPNPRLKRLLCRQRKLQRLPRPLSLGLDHHRSAHDVAEVQPGDLAAAEA